MTDQPPIKTKSGIGHVLWWLFVVACCLWGALELAKGHMIAAGAFIAAAVAAMPPVRAWLKRISGGRAPGWSFATVPFVFWLLAAGNSGPPTPPRVATPQQPTVREETVDVVANIVRFQGAYIGASGPCKSAFQAIAEEGQSGAPQAQRLYQMASIAQRLCGDSRYVIGRIELPAGLSKDDLKTFRDVRATCDEAYRLGEQTAAKLKAALDDEMRPSKVAAFQDSAEYAVAVRTSCEAKIGAAVEAAVLVHRDDMAPSQ